MNKDQKCNKCNYLQNGVCIIYGFIVDKPESFSCEDYERKENDK